MSKRLRNGRNDGLGRFVQLPHYLLDTPAWKSLDAVARSLYVELKYRFNGSNNGRIPYGVREAAPALRIGKSTAARGFGMLKDRGFIIACLEGTFDRKKRHASEWLLTEHRSNIDIEHPDRRIRIKTFDAPRKDFMRWGRPAATHSQQPRPVTGLTGSVMGLIGPHDGTVNAQNRRHGT